MSQRFFSTDPLDQDQVRLRDQEAHHLLHVMRCSVGDEVTVFDGSGVECLCRIEELGRSEVVLAVLSREEVDRELPIRITLAVTLPKGDRQKWLVEKAVELGVARLIPLTTERSVAQPVSKALDRLRRSVIEAAKQCGRNRLLEISSPVKCEQLLADVEESTIALIAHPRLGERAMSVREIATQLKAGSEVVVALGPEGGFSDEEVAAACEAGWKPLDLGTRILRIETAALAIAAQLAAASET